MRQFQKCDIRIQRTRYLLQVWKIVYFLDPADKELQHSNSIPT